MSDLDNITAAQSLHGGKPMTTVIAVHEVENGERWAKGFKADAENLAKMGVTTRTFRDPQNPNLISVMAEAPDMKAFQVRMQSDEARKVFSEAGVKLETLRMLIEFTP